MKDKEFLERVEIAYKVYKEKNKTSQDVEQFITWLYKQYGYIKNKDSK